MKILLTFGTTGEYEKRAERLINLMKELDIFDKIILLTEQDLKNDPIFWNQHKTFIENNKRGYGYWVWKSYIIKKQLEILNDNDTLLYLDSSIIFRASKDKFIDLFNIVKRDYIIGSYCRVKCLEYVWNKMDLIENLDMNHDAYLNTRQRQAGSIMILNNKKTRELIDNWYTLSSQYHFIDDTPSIIKNISGFKEHRHDQSIYSLLTKKYNIYSNVDMVEFLNLWCLKHSRPI
uniref:Nucleotide-diphospho-sugar transferase domain-containing protein n=1 Tax=viral metagenome TaxID=1070528 RepID=A0A6C0BQ83_9ZZZZ